MSQINDDAIPDNTLGVVQSLEQLSSSKYGLAQVDFSKPELCERTNPVSCIINGIELSGRTWARLLAAITEMFISTDNPAITSLYKQSLSNRNAGYPFIMQVRIDGLSCAKLSNGYWINVNYNIPLMVDHIGRLCVHCGVNLNDILITYTLKRAGGLRRNDSVASAPSTNDKMISEYIRQQGLDGTRAKDIVARYNVKAQSSTMKLLEADADIIVLPDGRYIHRSNIVDLNEAANGLKF